MDDLLKFEVVIIVCIYIYIICGLMVNIMPQNSIP